MIFAPLSHHFAQKVGVRTVQLGPELEIDVLFTDSREKELAQSLEGML